MTFRCHHHFIKQNQNSREDCCLVFIARSNHNLLHKAASTGGCSWGGHTGANWLTQGRWCWWKTGDPPTRQKWARSALSWGNLRMANNQRPTAGQVEFCVSQTHTCIQGAIRILSECVLLGWAQPCQGPEALAPREWQCLPWMRLRMMAKVASVWMQWLTMCSENIQIAFSPQMFPA